MGILYSWDALARHSPLVLKNPDINYKKLQNYCIRCYFREFRESDPHKNFHFNLHVRLFIAMKTSEKL